MSQKRAVTFLESPENPQIIFTIKPCTHFGVHGTYLSSYSNLHASTIDLLIFDLNLFHKNVLSDFMIFSFLLAPAPRLRRGSNLMGTSAQNGLSFFLLFVKNCYFKRYKQTKETLKVYAQE